MDWIIIVFGAIFLGGLLGKKLSDKENVFKVNDQLSTVLIIAILFIMGFRLGNNGALLEQLPTIGLIAFIITITSMLGSFIVVHYLVEKKKDNTKNKKAKKTAKGV